MIRCQKSKILLITILICFFSGTIPAFINNKPIFIVPEKIKSYDSSRIILLLDTTVLGPFFFPVAGKVISPYGRRGHRMHTGTDIKLAHGDTVRAAFSGIVTKSDQYYGYGILVILQHPELLETYYAHLSKALVKDGDTIRFGTPLGLGGRTGRATTDHLHFEIRKKGKALNSEHFFNFNDGNIKSLVLLKDRETNKNEDLVYDNVKDELSENITEKEDASEKLMKEAKVKAVKKKYHTIKGGDTLFSLSRRYGTSVEEICKLNGIKKSGVLKVGKKLRII